MTATSLNRETNGYWNLIKDANYETKLALISRLSNALILEMPSTASSPRLSLVDDILANAPSDAPLSEEDIMQEIKAVRYAQ